MQLYIERWLVAPFEQADGTREARTSGTPQGGVVSPLLSNLFLHYVFDRWMERHFPDQSIRPLRRRWCGALSDREARPVL